jgi:trans-2-enoyl-CoA reductase
MVLFVNCFITNQSSTGGAWEAAGIKQDRGNLKKDNKIDVLKYTLASFAKFYPWKRAIIKVQLDDDFYSEEIKQELESFIKNEFKHIDLIFSNKRIVTQQEWKEVYELINDDLIHVYCSHDHVILDSSPKYFSQ